MSKLLSTIQLSGSRFRGRRSAIWVFVIYVVLSIVITWPLITTLGQRIPAGTGGDVWANQWGHWWVKHALTEGINPFVTNLLYFPNGVSLATYNIPWVNSALWIPLQAVIGNYAAYSLLYIVIFAFNCFVMYILVNEWYESVPAAFVAGLIYGFFPFVVSHNGQPNWILISWLPLALLFISRTVQNGRVRDAVIGGIFIALIGLTRWHLLILSFVVLAIYILYLYWTDRSRFSQRIFLLLGLSAVIALIIMLPLAWPVLNEFFTADIRPDFSLDDTAIKSTNLLAYFFPNENLALWGKIAPHLPGQLHSSASRIEFIGLIVLLLAIIGVVAFWKKAWPWVLMVLIFVIFALGPVLEVGVSQFAQIPMPYHLLQDFVLIRMLRHASRFNALLGLPLALLAALGVMKLQQTKRLGKKPLLLIIGLSTLILMEYVQVPYHTVEPRTPSWYEQLAQEQDHFAILDLPMQPKEADKIFMHYQMTHGKSLVGGHVSRLSRDAFESIEDSEILSSLQSDNTFGSTNVDVSHQLTELSDLGIRYIILHKKYETTEKIDEWMDWLTISALFEDDDLIVYRTDPINGREFDITHQLTNEIGLIEASFWPDQVYQAEQVRIKLRWGSSSNPADDYQACVELVNEQGAVYQIDCNAIPENWPTRKWQRSEVVRGDLEFRVDPFFEPGNYSVRLVLKSKKQEVVESMVFGELRIDGLPRIYEAVDSPITADAEWANLISLSGYELNQSDDNLQLTLYWQAMRRIGKSYKFFVHLIDPVSGQVVAQVDAIPRDWTYPTDWWDEGEIVIDSVELPLIELNPGTYRLQVGFYDPENGVRLTARSGNGSPYADDVVPLTTIEHP